MKKNMRLVLCKLKSRKGESIGETLIALLISALALVMLAGAISSTANMIAASDKQMGKYYDGDGKLVEKNGEAPKSVSIKITGSTMDTETRTVDCFENNAFPSKLVISYKVSES